MSALLLARDDDITCLTEEEGPHFSEGPLAISENLQLILISDNYLTSFLSLSIQKRLILALQIHKYIGAVLKDVIYVSPQGVLHLRRVQWVISRQHCKNSSPRSRESMIPHSKCIKGESGNWRYRIV